MIRFIIKSNEWYEKLPELKGFIFYLSLIFIPYTILLILVQGVHGNICAIFWPLIVALWRMSYKLLVDFKKIKESKTKQ